MPFTTLVAGTVITANWANANVRDQVVTPFASTAARDTAITAPLAGQLCYVTSTNRLFVYTGSAWRICATPNATISGIHSDNSALAADDTGTIVFGVTFASAPTVVGTINVGSNLDLVLNWTGAATTTGVPYRVVANNGASWASIYYINWIAVGPLAA